MSIFLVQCEGLTFLTQTLVMMHEMLTSSLPSTALVGQWPVIWFNNILVGEH